MEARVAFRRGQAVLRQQVGVVQVYGLVELATDRIDVDNLKIVIDRAWGDFLLPALFPWNLDRRHVNAGAV